MVLFCAYNGISQVVTYLPGFVIIGNDGECKVKLQCYLTKGPNNIEILTWSNNPAFL